MECECSYVEQPVRTIMASALVKETTTNRGCGCVGACRAASVFVMGFGWLGACKRQNWLLWRKSINASA
ncbi:hypothetical protein IG631_10523 [Alternaria alternata]|nr:hypothetical protein IG631_10523 [Alternaria alternata]